MAWWKKVFLLVSCGVVFFSEAYSLPALAADEKSSRQATGSEDDVLVRWDDGNVLTKKDFQSFLLTIPEGDRAGFRGNMQRITGTLENLLVQRTLAKEASREGLDKSEDVVLELAYIKERFLAKKQMEIWVSRLKLPDFTLAAEEYYAVHPEEFSIKNRVRASHILVSTKSRDIDAARARAEEVHAKALKGEKFEDLVVEYSDDPSSQKNKGDLGFFERKQMVKPFADAAFALKNPGDISPVVETEYGFHVIQLIEHIPGELQPFANVKAEIIERLKNEYIGRQQAIYLATIKNDKTIKLNESAIDSLYVDTDAAIRKVIGKDSSK